MLLGESAMSAKQFSRDFAIGKVKKLRRMKQPVALQLQALPVRNPVVLALAQRTLTSAAGKHIRSQGAQRRADKVSLRQQLPALLKSE
jgi:hypothetical protein